MAALVPVVGDVTAVGATPVTTRVQAGEAITQGQTVYKKVSENKWYRASNDVDDEKATAGGVSLDKADSADDYITVIISGELDIGTTVVLATEYVVGITEGDIVPKADLATGNRYTRIGYGKTATNLVIDLEVTGVLAP